MTLLRRLVAWLGVESRADDWRRVSWPTREQRPKLVLPKRLTWMEVAELRKETKR